MAKILLMRHGQDADNAAGILNGHRDRELTELGREQARAAGERLKGEQIGAILSSPLKRAKETAGIIANSRGMAVVVEPLLIERDFGEFTGKPVAEIPKLTDKILSYGGDNFFLDALGSESFPALYARAERAVKKIIAEYPGKTVLAVAHGDIGKMIRAVCGGKGWEDGLKSPHIDNAEIIRLELDFHMR